MFAGLTHCGFFFPFLFRFRPLGVFFTSLHQALTSQKSHRHLTFHDATSWQRAADESVCGLFVLIAPIGESSVVLLSKRRGHMS